MTRVEHPHSKIPIGRFSVDSPTPPLALIGFPSDEGVRRNGGRPGAAQGPDHIRQWLYRLTPDARLGDAHIDVLRRTIDLGNVICTGELEADQSRLGQVISQVVAIGALPVVLGGGHETTYGHFLGLINSRDTAIVNIDAHTDVRPLIHGVAHSGSPFRQALEHPSGRCSRYSVLGLGGHCVAAEHVAYIQRSGGLVIWKEECTVERFQSELDQSDRVLLTLDLDALDGAHAPGVSAANADGISSQAWYSFALTAGLCKSVAALDIVELNPEFDRDEATARLAARTVWEFSRGLSQRPTN